MYDVYLITNNIEDESSLLEFIEDKGIFLTTYDTTTKTGKKEGYKLKSSIGAKLEPCIIVKDGDTVVKCFYSEASTTVLGDFLNWLNDTKSIIMNNEVIPQKLSFNERMNVPIEVPVVNKSNNDLPEYATDGSAGMDLRACLETPVIIPPLGRKLIPTELYLALPKGFEAQIRPRSGLALKHGITVLNTPGTIDSDYRNSIGVILINLSQEPFTVNNGDRIAQMVITRHSIAQFKEVDTLDETERGLGGFGHTGVK